MRLLEGIIDSFSYHFAEIIGAGLAWCIGYLILRNREHILSSLDSAFKSVIVFVKYALIISAIGIIIWGGYRVWKRLHTPAITPEKILWYRGLAEQGVADAQYELGLIYINVSQDYEEGTMWLNRAAAQGFEPAKEALSSLDK